LNVTVADAADELTPVSQTAIGVARIRAAESERPDRLFDDPYAAAFVAAAPTSYDDERGRTDDERMIAARLAVHVTLRTRLYDEYLLAATAAGIRQVVLVAAGLDTRAYRLEWPTQTRVFEVDLPAVLEFKDGVLAGQEARCHRIAVPADLTSDWTTALRDSGFDVDAPTAWLVEGLLVYLYHDDAERLLSDITAQSADGSRVASERGATTIAADGSEPAGVTALWKGGLAQGVDTWLRGNGWTTEVHGLAVVAAAYGRPLRTETQSAFVTAVR
jgi:methyltransferase (TIGR00027 family)